MDPEYLDFDEDLIGEAPCEFCGELYPLCLLIEHQTTHLNEDHYFEEDNNFPQIAVNERINIEPKKVEEEKQMMPSSVHKQVEAIPVQPVKTLNQASDSKANIIDDAVFAKPLKDPISFTDTKTILVNDEIVTQPLKPTNNSEIKKNQFKNYHSQIEEFTTEKGEKLLVYGADIEPVENLESEKQSYKKPNNPLLSSITKEPDVIDINSLSDDDCDESLEEFWKRARDLLKRNRGKI